MNTKKALIVIAGLAVLTLITLFVLDSSQTEENIEYTYLTSGEYTSYEIEHVVKGYENSVYESTEYGLTDEEKQALFEEYNEQKAFEAEYQEARATAESDNDNSNDFVESEEDRIEAYCDEEGFLSCANIKYTAEDEYTYHLVTIVCEDYDYDPAKEINWGKKYGCDDWEVTVAEEDFDIREVDESYWEGYGYVW